MNSATSVQLGQRYVRIVNNRPVVSGALILVVLCVLLVACGCQSVKTNTTDATNPIIPTNDGDWLPSLAVLARAEFQGNLVRLRNIRNFRYRTEEDFDEAYYDKTYNLNDLVGVDFVVVPFTEAPALAHTMLSFEFKNGEFLSVSVEARLEHGESYSPVSGVLRQFEIIYVVADERDTIPLRTETRDVDVYIYRTRATPEQSRRLFIDIARRINTLAEIPEFYDLITNNCTTNIIRHVNVLFPGKVPPDYRALLPGYADQLAFDLGMLDTDVTFEETKRRAHVNGRVEGIIEDPDFGRKIRDHSRPTDPLPASASVSDKRRTALLAAPQ